MSAVASIPQAAPALPAPVAPQGKRHRRALALAPLALGSSPALLPACCFAMGIVAAGTHWWVPGWLLCGLLPLAALVLAAAWQAPRILAVPLAALFLVLGCLAAELQPPVDPQQQLGLLAGDGTPVPLTGEVVRVEPLRQSTYKAFFGHKSRDEIAQRIDLRLSQVREKDGREQTLTGGIRMTVFTNAGAALPDLHCGTILQATLAPRQESHYGDPGVWDAAGYMHSQGVGALGSVDAAKIRLLGQAKPTLACALHDLQSRASRRVLTLAQLPAAQHLPPFLRISTEDASMLTAMLTGDRTYLQRRTRIGFERTGSFHLLVVSGMHLAIFSSVVLLVSRRLRLPRVAGTVVTIALSFAYALFTGYGQPVQRSFWMVTLFLVGRLIYRERHALQALGVAGLLLLAADPRALAGSSLQMTLLTVVAIGGLAAPLAERSFGPYLHGARQLWLIPIDASLPRRVAQWRVLLRLLANHLQPVFGGFFTRRALPVCLVWLLRGLELLLVSFVVELVMALPMAIYFHRITVLGLPVNVLIIPFLGLLLPAAMLCFAVVSVAPGLAVAPAAFTAALLHLVSGIVDTFAHLRAGDYRLPAPPTPRILAWVLLLSAAVYLLRHRGRWAPRLALGLLGACASLAVAPQRVRHLAGTLQVFALDVGQGDAILVITPDGKTMLVDAGGLVGQSPGSNFDIGEEVVSPALWARGIQRLDAVAITHAHQDHIGGMAAVLANFHPRVLLVGNNPHSPAYAAVLAQAAAQGVPVVQHFQGDRWQLGAATQVSALWPSREYVPKAEPSNNDSLVLRLGYGHSSALLEGDAQALAEAAMLRAGLPHTDLLKVGHHGSLSSSIPAFLTALSPTYAAISCGRRNFYGHPRAGTLDKLQTARAQTLRTDTSGEAEFILDGKQVSMQPWVLAQRE